MLIGKRFQFANGLAHVLPQQGQAAAVQPPPIPDSEGAKMIAGIANLADLPRRRRVQVRRSRHSTQKQAGG
jgi:hypothetical protein